jgi:hypothetical protein
MSSATGWRPPLSSLVERSQMAAFHFGEAMDKMNLALEGRGGYEILSDLMLSSDEAGRRFRTARFQAAAHVIACLESLHATTDTLAHVIYFALGMNLGKHRLDEVEINMWRVLDRLHEGIDTAPLARLAKDHCAGDDYKHLSAMVNHSKHRSIVNVMYSVSTVESAGRDHGFKFQPFKYRGKVYPERWLGDFLEPEYDRLSQCRVRLGVELNAVVATRLAQSGRGAAAS